MPELCPNSCVRVATCNMVRAGISERVAMSISGHKTRKIFDRYHIVPPRDLEEAAKKSEARQQSEADGHNFGHETAQTTSTPATKVN